MKNSIKKIVLSSSALCTIIPTTTKSFDIDWRIKAAAIVAVPSAIALCIYFSNKADEKKLKEEEAIENARPLKDIVTSKFIDQLAHMQEITNDFEAYKNGKISLAHMIEKRGFRRDLAYPLIEYIHVLPSIDLFNPTLQRLENRLEFLKQEMLIAAPKTVRSKHAASAITLKKAREQSVIVQNYIDIIQQNQKKLAEIKSFLYKTEMYVEESHRKNKLELENALNEVNKQLEGIRNYNHRIADLEGQTSYLKSRIATLEYNIQQTNYSNNNLKQQIKKLQHPQ